MANYDVFLYTPVEHPNLEMTRTPARTASLEDRLGSFGEIEQTYTPDQARCEAERCLNCPTHWCQKKCPIGMDVPGFIARLRAGDVEGAYEIIRTYSTLPEFCSRVCPQYKQCQSECTRSLRGEAVAIGRLERYAVEEYHRTHQAPGTTPAPDAKSVAVIGSGPSGLTVASELADRGLAVTVYERRPRLGGLLQYGIPGMKLDKDVVADTVARLERKGVRFVTGTQVGKDVSAQQLRKDFDAVVLCAGAGVPRPLALEGAEQISGIYNAVDYLTACYDAVRATGSAAEAAISARDKHVVVLGGGDTGNDCIGAALRQGCASLVQLELMPKDPVAPIQISFTPAEHQDIPLNTSQEEARAVLGQDPHLYQTTIQSARTDGEGKLEAVTLVSMQPVRQRGSRRFTMEPVAGTERTIPCQMLVNATGFVGTESALAQAFGVDLTQRGNLEADARRFSTNVPGVFACGDCRSGQSLVVKAMLEGRNCAQAVADYLLK